MRIRTDSIGGRHVVELAGRFDAHETQEFRLVVDPLLTRTGTTVRLDLSEVVFIDSSALAELVRARRTARAGGGDIVLTAVSTPVRVILELTAMNGVFTVDAAPS